MPMCLWQKQVCCLMFVIALQRGIPGCRAVVHTCLRLIPCTSQPLQVFSEIHLIDYFVNVGMPLHKTTSTLPTCICITVKAQAQVWYSISLSMSKILFGKQRERALCCLRDSLSLKSTSSMTYPIPAAVLSGRPCAQRLFQQCPAE